jgi:hypothetical protein
MHVTPYVGNHHIIELIPSKPQYDGSSFNTRHPRQLKVDMSLKATLAALARARLRGRRDPVRRSKRAAMRQGKVRKGHPTHGSR